MNIATHNGIITIQNPATGQHRTFRVYTQPADAKFAPGQRVVSLLTGPDNTSDYRGFGFVKDDGRIILWRSYREKAFETFSRMLQAPAVYEAKWGMRYMYEGRCRRCNRVLTTPESVESGIGPVCAGRS